MNDRFLTVTLFVLLFVLGLVLLSPNRSVSRVMENCGNFISQSLGL